MTAGPPDEHRALAAVQGMHRVAMIRPAGESSAWSAAAFRTVDVVGAALALLLAAPVMALIALAIRLESRGPVLVRQTCLGLDLEPFVRHGFRTTITGGTQDGRCTRVGRVLRFARAHRLPQLWDVLRGPMSLVGPAPVHPFDVTDYHPAWFLRFAVKPGLTCLSRFGADRRAAMDLDLEYVRRRCVSFNVLILVRTAVRALDPRHHT